MDISQEVSSKKPSEEDSQSFEDLGFVEEPKTSRSEYADLGFEPIPTNPILESINKLGNAIKNIPIGGGMTAGEAASMRGKSDLDKVINELPDVTINNIKESFLRGNVSAEIDQASYMALTGELDFDKDVKPLKDQQEKIIQSDPIKGKNTISKAIYDISSMVPSIAKGIIEGAGTGAGAGLAVASTGIGAPTALAAFGVGTAVGSYEYWRRQGAGQLYAELRSNDIPDQISKPIAHLGGAMYSAIEFSQVDKLIPGVKNQAKLIIADSLKRTIGKLSLIYGANWAEEVGEEGLQEIVQGTSKEVASILAGTNNKSNERIIFDVLANGWEAAKSSAIPMLLLMGPSAAVAGKEAVASEKIKEDVRREVVRRVIEESKIQEEKEKLFQPAGKQTEPVSESQLPPVTTMADGTAIPLEVKPGEEQVSKTKDVSRETTKEITDIDKQLSQFEGEGSAVVPIEDDNKPLEQEISDVKKNIPRVEGGKQEGEKPIATGLEQGTGEKTPETGGVLQTPKEKEEVIPSRPEDFATAEEYVSSRKAGILSTEDLELAPEKAIKQNIVGAAFIQDGKIIGERYSEGAMNHSDIAEKYDIDYQKAKPGFIDKEGNFLYQFEEDIPKSQLTAEWEAARKAKEKSTLPPVESQVTPSIKAPIEPPAKPPASTPKTQQVVPEGEKIRGLSKSVEERAIKEGLVESLGDLPTYKTRNMDEVAAKVSEFINNDYDLAKRIALGEAPEQGDVRSQELFTGLSIKALAEDDIDTIRELALSEKATAIATELGQRVKAYDAQEELSPVSAIRDIQDVRTKSAEKKIGKEKIKSEKKSEVANIKESIKAVVKKQNWAEFIKSLEC